MKTKTNIRLAIITILTVCTALWAMPGIAHGQIYVTNNASGTIGEYDAVTGAPINAALVSGLSGPFGIAVSGGHIYVTLNTGGGPVAEYDATTGTVINASLISQPSGALSLALSGNNLYVLGQGNPGSIGVYDATTGAPINASLVTGLSGCPYAIAVSGGYLYLTGSCFDNPGVVAVYDATTGASVNPSLISVENGVSLVVSGGSLWVGNDGDDHVANAVGLYNAATGATINASLIPGLTGVHGIAVLGGSLFVADGGTIGKYDAITGAPINASLVSGLANPAGIAVVAPESAGTLYVSYPYVNNGAIEKFDLSTGTDLGVFTDIGLSEPYGMAFDNAGNLYVANVGSNSIEKFSPDGTDLGVFASAGLDLPNDLAFDRAGNLYVSNSRYGSGQFTPSYVEKFTPAGVGSLFANVGRDPQQIAFDNLGNLYVCNGNDYTISKVAPDGSTSIFASLSTLGGVAIDSADNVYPSLYFNNAIEKFSPAGSDLGVFANTGLSHPTGLAFDSANNLYVSNDNNTISKITPGGSVSLFATTSSFPQYIAIKTASIISTPTPTPTATATFTPTPTATATFTPTPTATFTPTPTPAFTPTPTPTPTPQPSPTPTPTPTPIPTPSYSAHVQQPINADGSSVFNANRGVVPVKFTLTLNGLATCSLPAATIALTRTAGGTTGSINESVYVMSSDSGSNFRIDSCQYVYNLNSAALGTGTYRVDILINGRVVGSGVFQLK